MESNFKQGATTSSSPSGGPPEPPKGTKLKFTPPKVMTGRGGLQARNDLGTRIRNMLNADEASMGDLMKSADQVDELYLGRKVISIEPPWTGAPTYNAKTLGTKLKQLVSFVIGPMVAQDPFFTLRAGGPKGNPIDAVQTILHFFLHRARYPLAMYEAASLTARRGRCPCRVRYISSNVGPDGRVLKPSIKLEPLDTRYFRIYPNTAAGIEDSVLHGHISQWTVQTVDEWQRSGAFFSDVKIRAGAMKNLTMGQESDDKQMSSSNAVYRRDDPHDVFEGIIWQDLDNDGYDEPYKVFISVLTGTLLQCDSLQIDRSEYADFFFERETGRYRPENSVGVDLVDTHHFVNDSMALRIWLTMYNGMPPIFIDSWAPNDDVTTMKPGDMIPIEGGGKVSSVGGGQVDMAAWAAMSADARQTADEVSTISQNGAGANLQSGTTAFEASRVAMGQQTGIQGKSAIFAYGACDIAAIVLELLFRNYDDWIPHYNGVLPQINPQDLQQEFWIEVNGETPLDTPQGQMQQMTSFLQSLVSMVQMDQSILQRYPDMIPNLLRASLETTTFSGKDQVLPTVEEEAAMKQEAMKQQALIQQMQGLQGSMGVPQMQHPGLPGAPQLPGAPNGPQQQTVPPGDGHLLQQQPMGLSAGPPQGA